MSLTIYNSLTQRKEEFVPIEAGKVRMYVCGVTVYDDCHLGHARAAVVFDVIYRYLKHKGFDVKYVRNFTDIDDKIINKSNETGEDWQALTKRYIASYRQEMQRLNVQAPDEEPLATEHISEMLQLVQSLEKNNLAYASSGDVFYAVRKLPDYGKLSHKKIDELESGSRVEVDERKRDPLDFVLWKAAKPGEPKWESPWGAGRPGWHLECSAMSMKYLGESFDIHGGGRDLIFPHHENEIAQSEGATGKPFAKYWVHNGFVNIHAEKMSKSLGNIRSIGAILDEWDPEVVRYFLLSAHYRSALDFTDEAMLNAQEALTRYYETLSRLEQSPHGSARIDNISFDTFVDVGMDDDFNTVYVIGEIFKFVRHLNALLDEHKGFDKQNKQDLLRDLRANLGDVLGVFASDPATFLDRQKKKALSRAEISKDEIEQLINDRLKARSDKDWKRADEIRDQLAGQGVVLKDNPDGTTSWEMRSD